MQVPIQSVEIVGSQIGVGEVYTLLGQAIYIRHLELRLKATRGRLPMPDVLTENKNIV